MLDQPLFPTDGSDGTDVVFDHVVDMTAAHNATLHLLHVVPPEFECRPSLTGGSEGDGADDDPSGRRRSDGG